MKFTLLSLSVLLLLAACAQTVPQEPALKQDVPEFVPEQEENPLAGMPCHQMPDGSWMGDCTEEDKLNPMDHSMHTVSTEEEFVVEMIPHHQEAVDTSLVIVANTENEALRDLAQRIIDAQEEEIAMMNTWVEEDYEGGYPATYQNMMPDLLSLSGVEQDHAYLAGMIAHHQMAVVMAESVLTLEPSEKVATFAQTVIEVQNAEIAEMQGLLE